MWIKQRKSFLLPALLLLLLLAQPLFSQDAEPPEPTMLQLLKTSRESLLTAIEQRDSLLRLINERLAMSTLLNQTTEKLSSDWISYKLALMNEIDLLTMDLHNNSNILKALQISMNEQGPRLTALEEAWKKASDLSTELLKQYRRDILRAVLITGGVCIGVSVVIIVVIGILNYQNIKGLLNGDG